MNDIKNTFGETLSFLSEDILLGAKTTSISRRDIMAALAMHALLTSDQHARELPEDVAAQGAVEFADKLLFYLDNKVT